MRSRLARMIAILNEQFILCLEDGIMTPVIRYEERYGQGLGARASPDRFVMRPSGFDLVSSFLLAAMVMLGSLVLMLLTIWVLSGNDPGFSGRVPPAMMASSSASAGLQEDFDVPAAAEVTDLVSPTLANLVAEVESASQQVASGIRSGIVVSRERGDGLMPGPEEQGQGMVPESQRWELTFLASSQQVYARQLDFHGIEIGALGGGFSGIDYASHLATGPTARHTEDARAEQRLYFSWVRPSPLASHERQLLTRAGIATAGRQILKFVPRELEIRLAQIELEYAQTQGVSSPEAIARTVFRSEGDGAECRFVVVNQRYKRGSSSVVIGASNN